MDVFYLVSNPKKLKMTRSLNCFAFIYLSAICNMRFSDLTLFYCGRQTLLLLIFFMSFVSIFLYSNIADFVTEELKLRNIRRAIILSTSVVPHSQLIPNNAYSNVKSDSHNYNYKHKRNRSEILREAVDAIRNLPKIPLNAEVTSEPPLKNGSGNGICGGVLPSVPSIFNIRFVNTYWQVANTSLGIKYLYGAYYDNRNLTIEEMNGPVVRVLGIMENYVNTNLTNYCQLWYENEESPVISETAEQRYLFKSNWSSEDKYHLHLFTCRLSKDHHSKIPMSLSIVQSPCENARNNLRVQYEKQESKKTFAVCVKALDFLVEDNSIRLVEWIEMQRILGAEKIFFYEYTLHPNVSKVLRHYENLGLVDITPYTLPGYLPNEPRLRHLYLTSLDTPHVWEQRRVELLTYNDCLYRNLYNYEYLVVVDTDEVIIPLHSNTTTWKEIVQNVEKEHPENFQKFAAISFRNVYFFDVWEMKDNLKLEDIPSYMHLLQHVYRVRNHTRVGYADKCFHRVERAFVIHNHSPGKCLGGKCKLMHVPPTQVQLQHYKPGCGEATNIQNCQKTIEHEPILDTTMWKYKNELIERTNGVLRNLDLLPDSLSSW